MVRGRIKINEMDSPFIGFAAKQQGAIVIVINHSLEGESNEHYRHRFGKKHISRLRNE